MNKILIATALLSIVAAAPASAAAMSCNADNMAKTSTAMTTMADGPAKMAMGKEMGMANADMSKGNMRGGCMHYMKAQKMGMMKQNPGMMNMGMMDMGKQDMGKQDMGKQDMGKK
jgi:hypothetical protein